MRHCLCLTAIVCLASSTVASDWLSFRGTNFTAASDDQTVLPSDSEINIAWQVPTAARGISSPIVVGDQVIVTSSGGREERDLYIESFDVSDGSRRWQQTFNALGRPYTHPTSANASPTPASNGTHIVALYSSCDLSCVTTEGDPVWFRALAVDHPKTGNDISMSSSPVIVGDVVIVQLENQGDSFVSGIDLMTGTTLWEQPRPATSGWASPIGFSMPDSWPGGENPMRNVVAFQNKSGVMIHDARTGDVLRTIDVPGSKTSSPTFADPLLLVVGDGLAAIDLSQSDCPVIWENTRLASRNASPVVRGNVVYVSKGSVLVAADLSTGDELWKERMPDIGSVWATPTATASGVYVWDQAGNVAVAVPQFDADPSILGPVKLTGPVLATPAVADNAIFVRANEALIKLAD
ncbi:MAG: PQQ-binding-like beta-propeller repeat protein [Planctomycetota bacterium]